MDATDLRDAHAGAGDGAAADSRQAAGGPAASRAATGIASIASDDFSVVDSIGGIRGVVESVVPSLLFLLLFLITKDLMLTVEISLGLCVAEMAVRLVQRQTVIGAISGSVMVLVCLFAAYKSGDARNYYLPGCILNAVFAVALLVSQCVRVPGIGLFVEFVRTMPMSDYRRWYHGWHDDARLLRAYTTVTWVWIALLVVRDSFQIPLYLVNNVTWLGAIALALGVPGFALTCWVSYLIIGTPLHEHRLAEAAARTTSDGDGKDGGDDGTTGGAPDPDVTDTDHKGAGD